MKKLYRSDNDKRLTGLCGGLARYFNLDTTLVRLLVAASALFSFGTVIFIYILGSIIVPKDTYSSSPGSYDYY